MKAQTLAISVPNTGCNKNCPYCISKMTGYMKSNYDLMLKNLDKVKRYADVSQVNNVIFTSKGEIFNSHESIDMFVGLSRQFRDYPIEIQTNGEYFLQAKDCYITIDALESKGVNVIAISIDKFSDIMYYRKVIQKFPNIIWRATVNMTSIIKGYTFIDIVSELKDAGFTQVSFREITTPNYGLVKSKEAEDTFMWIAGNTLTVPEIAQLKVEMDYRLKNEGRIIRKLPYGATLYDLNDMAITYFDYCIQDSSSDDDVRSLIFQEDGHLYTTWNSKASIIF